MVSETAGILEAADVQAEKTDSAAAETSAEVKTAKKKQGTWVKIKGKYYWQYADGTIRRKAGTFSAKGNTYCTYRDGSRVESVYRKIKGRYYYFKANGKVYKPQKAQFRRLGGKTCYFYTDGHVAAGRTKIGSKYYYFDAKGALQTNQKMVQIKNNYYSTDAKGVMTKIPVVKAKCQIAARDFINRHSDSSQLNAGRLRSCFNYLLGYMQYRHFDMEYSYSVIDKKNGIYELALYTFQSASLQGNCHNFASCFAVIAKELGYSPTMVTMKGDHSFVMIGGGYYDNMYGGLFGAASRPAYSVYKSVTL